MRKISARLLCAVCLLVVAAALVAGTGAGAAGEPLSGQGREYAPVRHDGSLVEVLVGGRQLDRHSARGKFYVEAVRGAEYELRIRNPFPVRVAVALSVDGLNTIDARRTGRWDASKWVIEPYQSVTIGGWQMSSERARRFYFTAEQDSYAAKLGRPSDLGVISAVFFRERSVAAPVTRPYPPPGAPRSQKDGRRSGESESASRAEGAGNQAHRDAAPAPADEAYAATGIGRSVHHDVRWVNLSLDPRPAAEVTIRYEYHDALVRLGILPRPRPYPDPLGRRERARGFEDQRYCPEP
ncbi:MAG: hypothetical protein ACRD68_03255 [Pyrinomonadaceae bacterium]